MYSYPWMCCTQILLALVSIYFVKIIFITYYYYYLYLFFIIIMDTEAQIT